MLMVGFVTSVIIRVDSVTSTSLCTNWGDMRIALGMSGFDSVTSD